MKTTHIITHSGRFHADECFGVAALKLVLGDVEVTRTRDPKIIETGDIVLDIGGVYDPEKKRFDHHQPEGAGKRDNGIPYASFGLIWKTYGEKICGSLEVANRVDSYLVAPIDAIDNGVTLTTPLFPDVMPLGIQGVLFLFGPTWQEKDRTFDQGFFEMLPLAEKIILRAVALAKADIESARLVEEAWSEAPDKRIVVLKDRYSYDSLRSHSEVLFVVLPDSQPDKWKAEVITETPGTFKARKQFPASWAGKRDKELQDLTGVSDAVFCHRAGFMVVAGSKEGAYKLAELALNS